MVFEQCKFCNYSCDDCPLIQRDEESICILCGQTFIVGIDGNELGFCCDCQEKKDFPYNLDKYYSDYDNNKTIFKGFETLSRGILEKYRR